MDALLNIEGKRDTLVDAAGLCASGGCTSNPSCFLQPDLDGREHGTNRLLSCGIVDIHGDASVRLHH